MNPQTDAAEAHTARQSSRAIGRWPGAWLRGELGLWRSITRRRPVVWTLLGAGLVLILVPTSWLARAWYLTRADRLHRAVYAGDIDEVRRLLAAGADVNQPSRTGIDFDNIKWTSSSHAGGGTTNSSHSFVTQIQIGNFTIYELPQWLKGDSPLHVAIAPASYSREVIALLVGAGADVNLRNDEGETPLHVAVDVDHLPLVHILLDVGADPDALDNHGRTPRSIGQSSHDPAIRALFAAAPLPTTAGDEELADRE